MAIQLATITNPQTPSSYMLDAPDLVRATYPNLNYSKDPHLSWAQWPKVLLFTPSAQTSAPRGGAVFAAHGQLC